MAGCVLAFGRKLALIPIVVANIQSRIRRWIAAFCPENPIDMVFNSRVELAYTYLVAWLVMHCYTLMSTSARMEITALDLQRFRRVPERTVPLQCSEGCPSVVELLHLVFVHQESNYHICV